MPPIHSDIRKVRYISLLIIFTAENQLSLPNLKIRSHFKNVHSKLLLSFFKYQHAINSNLIHLLVTLIHQTAANLNIINLSA